MQQFHEPTAKERFLRRLTDILHQNRIWLTVFVIGLLAFVVIYTIGMEVQQNRIESISVLAESEKAAQDFAQNAFDPMDGAINYQISTQLKTKRLASKEVWRRHHKKYISSFDKQHEEDFDDEYDWTDDFEEYAALTGAFVHEFD